MKRLIPCPSCGRENFTLHLRCENCGAFIRDRVPALDLFSTLWGMIEAPSMTALHIGRSEQKNYTHLLFALAGPLLFAVMLFVARLGDTAVPFGLMMLGIVAVGPVVGLLLFPLMTLWQILLLRLTVGISVTYRLGASYVAWSITPIVWASVIVLPLLLGVFGLILFSTNPAPWEMLALPFWVLGGLCLISLPWSMLLLPLGFRVHGSTYRRLLLLQCLTWLLPATGVVIGGLFLRQLV